MAFLADSLGAIFYVAGLINATCGLILPGLIWLGVFGRRAKKPVYYFGSIVSIVVGVYFLLKDALNI